MMNRIVKNCTSSSIIVLFRAILFSQVAVRHSTTITPIINKFASMKADLYFVRHGETEANRDGVLQGHCDFPLTDRGVKQCEQVGDALRSIRWNKVFSSDLPRTLRTTDILLSKSETYKVGGTESLTKDALLREMNFGVKEMLPRETTFEAAIQIVALREGIKCEDVVDLAETNVELKIRQHRFLSETVFPELVAQGFPSNNNSPEPPSIPSDGNEKAGNEEINSLLTRDSGNPKILCISHGGFIRRFLLNYCDLEYVASSDNESYPGASILSSVFGIKATKLIRLSNCSVSVVTVEWPLGALQGEDYVCCASADDVNIISHLKD